MRSLYLTDAEIRKWRKLPTHELLKHQESAQKGAERAREEMKRLFDLEDFLADEIKERVIRLAALGKRVQEEKMRVEVMREAQERQHLRDQYAE